jgi:response regulator RpfG family c-di-GMP phosphodiesterase
MKISPESEADIIVVDDQPANLKLLDEMLKVSGYKIRSFPRGRLALAASAQSFGFVSAGRPSRRCLARLGGCHGRT